MNFTVLPFLESDAAHQMELDMKLLRIFTSRDSSSIIRFYRIFPPAITIGYHQNEKCVLQLLGDCSVDIVKRPTGGRAVLHLGDLTYSVLGRVASPFFGSSTVEIYHAISKGVKRGIEKFGVRLDFAEDFKSSSSPLCFEFVSKYELSCEGEKLTGGALLKRNGLFLFQGSIRVDSPPKEYAELCGSTVSLNTIAGKEVKLERLLKNIKAGFEEEFGVEIKYRRWPNLS